jgi:hypothetical protein
LVGAPGDPVEKFYGRDSADFLGSDFSRCKGDEFSPAQLPRESTTVALRTLPSHGLHIVTFFSKAQRYGLTVAQGYFTADSRIRPDAFEENDMCHYADRPSQRINQSATPFSDTLTIDNPFELDWYRIQTPAMGLADSVLIRIVARPFIAGRDTSDIDVYVLTVPGVSGPGVAEVASSLAPGSTESLVAGLSGNSAYYLAVTDFAGVATRYSLCMRVVTPLGLRVCPLILPGPPAPVSSTRATRAPRRTAAPAPAAGAAGSLFGRRPPRP